MNDIKWSSGSCLAACNNFRTGILFTGTVTDLKKITEKSRHDIRFEKGQKEGKNDLRY